MATEYVATNPDAARGFIDAMFERAKSEPRVYQTIGEWLGTLFAQQVVVRAAHDDAFAMEAAGALMTLVKERHNA